MMESFEIDREKKLKKMDEASILKWRGLRFGMFIHFGVYSLFGGVYKGEKIAKGYSEQIMQFAPIPREDYLLAAGNMNLERFSPADWVGLAREAGMKYLVVTSKHHDGFCMFDTKTTDFNIVKRTPFSRDFLKLLEEECKRQGLGFGLYFSLVDWNLGHRYDPDNRNAIPPEMEEILCEQLNELVTGYGELCEIWFDMSTPTPTQSLKFKEIVRKHQPSAMINGRIGNGLGDFITFWDNEIPKTAPSKPWQTPQSIYPDTWGYRSWREHDNLEKRTKILISNFESVTSRGGNYLLNIGPRGDGSVDPYEREILLRIGRHLERSKSIHSL